MTNEFTPSPLMWFKMPSDKYKEIEGIAARMEIPVDYLLAEFGVQGGIIIPKEFAQ